MVEVLLSVLRRDGVRLWCENGRLHYRAPKGALTRARLSEIRAQQAEIVAFLESSTVDDVPSIVPEQHAGAVPLSFAQERLWFLEQLGTSGAEYHISETFRLKGKLDRRALEQSLSELISRHEILRTHFEAVDGRAVQFVGSANALRIDWQDLSKVVKSERMTTTQNFIRTVVDRPFDLGCAELLRVAALSVGDEDHVLVLVMHHIVSDGWSLGVLIRELGALYAARVEGREPRLPELPIQYVDYALWQRRVVSGEVLERQLGYWKTQLAGAPAGLDLPADRPRPAVPSYRGASHRFTIGRELTSALAELARTRGATLFMVLLAAFDVLLARWSGQDDVVVGTPIAGRTRAETEGLIGFFVNTLALRSDVADDPRFETLLRRVKETALAAYSHQELPFEKLVEALHPVRDLSRQPIFQVMFSLQNVPGEDLVLPGLTVSRIDQERPVTQFDLMLVMQQTPAGLVGQFQYATDLFEAGTIARLAEHFVRLLDGIVADPQRRVSELALLGEAERHQLVSGWNDTAVSYPQPHALHELFAAQAARTPDAVAVTYEDEVLSYAALEARANQLAHYLRRRGVGAETVVGLCAERSLAMVVGLLGILKAGGAYLPLDPSYPAERLGYMLGDARAPVLLTQAALLDRLPVHSAQIIQLDADAAAIAEEPVTAPRSGVDADNLAYVIYTSGSTGRPKGVMNSHRGILNRILWMQDAYRLSATDRVLQKTPFGFDVSVWEFFWPLAFGARLVVARPGGHQDPVYLSEVIERAGVTIAHFVPSMLQAFLEAGELERCGSLRDVMCSGEALPVETQNSFLTRLSARLHNLYGPTEAAVDVSAWRCAVTSSAASVPIGRPISNIALYVVDRYGEPVPVGVAGELLIGGIGVARGYLGRGGLTAERFVPSPFGAGERLYRTGDLARWRADGALEFLGRLDFQVKLRGLRIELGEIEAALLTHAAVAQAVVVARKESGGDKRLIGYVVPAAGASADIDADELRSHLKRTLPDYMVPPAFVVLEQLPLSANGKLDRKALPAPDASAASHDYLAPRNTVEATLASIFAEVLHQDRVGINDNFFELGGDSILSIQMVARANRAGLALNARQMFEQQTVAGLAAVAGTAAAVRAEQGAVDGEVPLTPIQHWFLQQTWGEQQTWSEPHHFNQAVLLEGQNLSPALVEQAIAHVIRHHDALRLRFARTSAGWWQAHAAGGVAGFEHIDLSDLDPSAQASALSARAERLQASLDLATGPLVRAALFDLGPRAQRLLIIIHHLVVDAVSWSILLEDLHTAYKQLAGGAVVCLPAKTTAFKHWAERLAAYAQSDAARRELGYWQSVPWSRGGVLPRDYRGGVNSVASARSVEVSLSAAETQALLRDVPGVYHTTINDVLLTALVEAFAPWTGQRALLLDLEGHGREALFADVDISRTVGWFTSLFPVLLELNEADDAGDALKGVKEQLRAIPRHGIGYGILRHLGGIADLPMPAAEVIFNYVGQIANGANGTGLFRLASESTGSPHSAQGLRPYLIEVNAGLFDGGLRVRWSYSTAVHAEPTIAALAERFIARLRDLIAHCASSNGGFTPSDFPLLSGNLDLKIGAYQ
jgi:amino acid adenylation domain-containing protein/non-ribosomal peptide synthase protein (TIGR01720 family)